MFNDDQGHLFTALINNVSRETIAEAISKLCKVPTNRIKFDSEYDKGRREHTVHYFRFAVFQF
jgi:hypothetical protein